jgi:hypothetical protein
LGALITLDVHGRDTVKSLAEEEADSLECFNWMN